MKSKKERSFKDFVSYRGEYSSGRLIFLIGSIVIIIQYLRFPESRNATDLMMAIMGYAAAATTVSKFAKQPEYHRDEYYESEGSGNFEEDLTTPPQVKRRSNRVIR